MKIDQNFAERFSTVKWEIVTAKEDGFIFSDSYFGHKILPISPKLCFIAQDDIEIEPRLKESKFVNNIRGAGQAAYVGQSFEIGLYSKNSLDGQKYWVGSIANLEVINDAQRKLAYKKYQENGWFEDMHYDLDEVGARGRDEFQEAKNIFNVRYKPEDLELLDEPDDTKAELEQINGQCYSIFIIADIGITKAKTRIGEFNFKPGHKKKSEKRSRVKGSKPTTMEKRHNEYQKKIFNQLVKIYGKQNVSTEQDTGFGSAIDICVRLSNGSFIFYELKTDINIRFNIRQALGQLLEYAHWNNRENIEKLIIVSPVRVTCESQAFMKLLRTKYRLEIYYQFFNPEKGLLEH